MEVEAMSQQQDRPGSAAPAAVLVAKVIVYSLIHSGYRYVYHVFMRVLVWGEYPALITSQKKERLVLNWALPPP